MAAADAKSSSPAAPLPASATRSATTAAKLHQLLTPQTGLAKMLTTHPARSAWIHAWLSQVTGDELRDEGRVYGGGRDKIEPMKLARISAKQLLTQWSEISLVISAQGDLFASSDFPRSRCKRNVLIKYQRNSA